MQTICCEPGGFEMNRAQPSCRLATNIVASLIGTITANVALAACPAGYYCDGSIETITLTDDAAYIRLVGGTAGLTNCTPYGQNYFTLPKANPNYSSYYATLLAAYSAKESVTLRPVDSSTNCTIAYIAVP
jgi:hypothetical protein